MSDVYYEIKCPKCSWKYRGKYFYEVSKCNVCGYEAKKDKEKYKNRREDEANPQAKAFESTERRKLA